MLLVEKITAFLKEMPENHVRRENGRTRYNKGGGGWQRMVFAPACPKSECRTAQNQRYGIANKYSDR